MNNTTMYVINAVLVLMVIRQIREHPLDLRSLAGPVLAVGAAAVLFLHSVPGGGNDVALELACVVAGASAAAGAGSRPNQGRHGASPDTRTRSGRRACQVARSSRSRRALMAWPRTTKCSMPSSA